MMHRWRVRRAFRRAARASMPLGQRLAYRGLRTALVLSLVLLVPTTAFVVLFRELSPVPDPFSIRRPQATVIEYSDGSVLARIGNVNRTDVPLAEVPAGVQAAVVAAEDRGFYSEPGFSLRGLVRAAVADVRGGDTEGGSGITQQFVKNAYLDDRRSLSRKLRELMISIRLSEDYSKRQILGLYLNTVYFGRGAYGIEAAARAYFGVDVQRLTDAQGALLAAILRAPSYYDPALHPTDTKQRWHYVVQGMVDTGALTAQQAAALRFPSTIPIADGLLGTTGWRYLLVNAVLADLADHGISLATVYRRGLRIRTTIDPHAQYRLVRAIGQTLAHPTPRQRNLKVGAAAIDPRTGAVLAYYGGTGPAVRGPDGRIDFNDWAGQQARPLGTLFSTFTRAAEIRVKQVLAYRIRTLSSSSSSSSPSPPAEAVFVPPVLAPPIEFGPTPDAVRSTACAMGAVELCSAGGSGRTAAGRRADHLLDREVADGNAAVSPLDEADVLATVADRGVRHAPFLVTQAVAADGVVVYRHPTSGRRALDTSTSAVLAAADTGRSGAAGPVELTGAERIDEKTGNHSDAWAVGFTPGMSVAVWIGSGQYRPIYSASGRPMGGRDEPARIRAALLRG